jgi:hypothetical protein
VGGISGVVSWRMDSVKEALDIPMKASVFLGPEKR